MAEPGEARQGRERGRGAGTWNAEGPGEAGRGEEQGALGPLKER